MVGRFVPLAAGVNFREFPGVLGLLPVAGRDPSAHRARAKSARTCDIVSAGAVQSGILCPHLELPASIVPDEAAISGIDPEQFCAQKGRSQFISYVEFPGTSWRRRRRAWLSRDITVAAGTLSAEANCL